MNFLLIFFILLSSFTCDCQLSTDESSENTDITTCDDNACGSISGSCTTVFLNEGDYLLVSENKLFVKPLSLTVNNSSYVNNNGTVAVCECLFYGRETSVSQTESCNLTIHDCPKIRLDPRDVLHLSDGTVFVKSLNKRLNDSGYGTVNGSVVVCECLKMDPTANVFNDDTCKYSIDQKTSMSTNCSTVTLKPWDYYILSNSNLRVSAWNLTLNGSYYSLANGSMTVCAPVCDRVVGFGLQLLSSSFMFFFFELLFSWAYSVNGTVGMNRVKCGFVALFYYASSSATLVQILLYPAATFDLFVVVITQLSFSGAVGVGMLAITSSDVVIKFLLWAGIMGIYSKGFQPKKPISFAICYCCCFIIPFVIAYCLPGHVLHSHPFANITPVCDYYYTKSFRDNIPLLYMYKVIFVFFVINTILLTISSFWNSRRWVITANDHVLFTYFMYLAIFMIVTFDWIFDYWILTADQFYRNLWILFAVLKLILSGGIIKTVTRDHRFNALRQLFTPGP